MFRFDITDMEWGFIEPVLPNKVRGVHVWMIDGDIQIADDLKHEGSNLGF